LCPSDKKNKKLKDDMTFH